MNKEHTPIILNWMLPAIPTFPSPAMSVLKSQLRLKGFDVKVVYWNFYLQPVVEHYWGKPIGDFDDHLIYYLSPIYAYLAIEMGDIEAIGRQREYWNGDHLMQQKTEEDFIEHIKNNGLLLRKIVSDVLEKYNYENCLFCGFYQKLFQMYGADIVMQLIKQKYPNVVAVLGGIDTKSEALAAMDSFSVFDYALWGEGEVTLQNFASMLLNKMEKHDVGNLVWRNESGLMVSNQNRTFVGLDESVVPDYSDYFEQATIIKERIRLPIEGSRGCHWARCRFCFHNEGTRYRRKSPQRIAEEIRQQMKRYNIYQISFLDNDTVGKDIENFKNLLNELSEIKKENPEFHITRAEVVTRSLNAGLVKKMADVGFKDVQIGYESLSDHLLEKIHKCNSFSTNFLFVKWALLSGINVRGANLIMNLLEETDEDLNESLNNLGFLRFMLKNMKFMHVYSTLWIKHSSRYFRVIEASGKLNEWKVYKSFRFLPESYLKGENKYALQFFVKPTFNKLWDNIEEKEWEYINHPRSYTIEKNEKGFLYKEYIDECLVKKEILSILEWNILSSANERVLEYDDLKKICSDSEDTILKQHLSRLKQLELIYYFKDYRGIVTVINTDAEQKVLQRYT